MDESNATTTSASSPTPRSGRPWWQWALGIALLGGALGHYIWSGIEQRPDVSPRVAIEPIRVSEDLREVDAMPGQPGALAGANVLLVTLDTTRADRIGCYGNDEIVTATLDGLASRGVLFSRAIAVTPTTLPTHSTVLTGLYPLHHGARVNGLYRLDDTNETLAEILSAAGYHTGAVISAFVLDRQFGTEQGFVDYHDDLSDCDAAHAYGYVERPADRTTDIAIEWLRDAATRDEPFFYWLHYFDPHALYEPPSPYDEEYAHNPYDGEIAFMDAEFGRVIATLEELGIDDNTLVVVVGDHGESLGQHNELTHAFLLYESTLHVPLIMACGERLGGGAHIAERVCQTDIMPTVLSLIGVECPETVDGVDLVAGLPTDRPVFVETLHGLMTFGWAALLGVYDGSDKYIHGPTPELYDVSADRGEQDDLLVEQPGRAEKMRALLVQHFGDDLEVTTVAEPTRDLSAADLEKMRAMGYVMATVDLPPPAKRPNPKDVMPAMHEVEAIVYTSDPSVDTDKKIAALKRLIGEYPEFHPAWRFLGDMYRVSQRVDDALAAYQRAAELAASPSTLHSVAITYLIKNDTKRARETFAQLVNRYPDHMPSQYFLGVLAGQRGEHEEAYRRFEHVFHVDPGFAHVGMAPCAVQLVHTAAQLDRLAELEPMLLARLENDPTSVALRSAIASVYAARSEYAEAEAVLREGVELKPDDLDMVATLAAFLVACPDMEIRRTDDGLRLVEQRAEQTSYKDPKTLIVLAQLYAHVGRIDESITLCQRAKTLAMDEGTMSVALEADELLAGLERVKATGRRPVAPGIQMLQSAKEEAQESEAPEP